MMFIALAYFLFFCLSFAEGKYTLNVNDGYGGGPYDAGALVHVFANIDPGTEIVTGWNATVGIGAIDGKSGLRGEWHFSFKMPSKNVTLTPIVNKISFLREQLEETTINNIPVWYHVPKNPVGLVGFFHGTKGSRDFILKNQPWYTALKFIHAGYGIFSASSDASVRFDNAQKKVWNTDPRSFCRNQDFKNIKLILEKFMSMKLISNKTKLHAIGMSNGGVFAYSLVQMGGLGFSSGVSTCAHGSLKIDPSQPFMWQMCGKDSQKSVAAKKGESLQNYNKLVAKKIPAIHLDHPPSPLYPERFSRIAGISVAASQKLYAYLKTKGLVDSQHYLKYKSDVNDYQLEDSSEFKLLSNDQKQEVKGEMLVAMAQHRYYDDYSQEIVEFFESTRHDGEELSKNFGNRSTVCEANILWWIIGICICVFILILSYFICKHRGHTCNKKEGSRLNTENLAIGVEVENRA
eukprot:g8793.t1